MTEERRGRTLVEALGRFGCGAMAELSWRPDGDQLGLRVLLSPRAVGAHNRGGDGAPVTVGREILARRLQRGALCPALLRRLHFRLAGGAHRREPFGLVRL